MISAEPGATGSLSTRWFHGFEAGKTGQPAIFACSLPPAPLTSTSAATNTGHLERIEHRASAGRRLEQAEEQVTGRRVGGRDPELGPEQAGHVGEVAAGGDL